MNDYFVRLVYISPEAASGKSVGYRLSANSVYDIMQIIHNDVRLCSPDIVGLSVEIVKR